MRNLLLLLFLFAGIVRGFAQQKPVPLDKELAAVKYPYPVKFHHFTSQGAELKMAYLDVPASQPNGKTILLLHGKNFNAAYWEQTIGELTRHGFRVVAPDQVGFGKSTKPAHYQYSFQQLAANTRTILDTLKLTRVIVLGHSMGGMLATRFALMYPAMTEKLVLENPLGLEDYKALVPYQTPDAAYRAELKNTPESYREYQLKYYYNNQWKPGYDRWLNLLAGWTLHTDYPVVAWNAALTSDMIFTQPVVYEFGNIKCPTLLIIGTRDRTAIGKERADKVTQETMGQYQLLGKRTQQAIPGAKLVELDNVGHLPHIEAFGRFIGPLLEFLER
ncbi:alpha/beta fold hydrolase [Pedobacter sp. HMF7056]|uniref:Alpha/beta fold hydrolase n=2 Tax=Hufsiella ginkgonis TaxID=2695274 RepID=A0A7K1XU83_9SPHI|nr:alpha/beta fold hydrolase [Hufsiella ginkgonis]